MLSFKTFAEEAGVAVFFCSSNRSEDSTSGESSGFLSKLEIDFSCLPCAAQLSVPILPI